jgi:unsaturated rhamnogalacturonyl hydrolase
MTLTTSQLPPALNHWAARMADSALQRYTLREARWHYEHGLLVMAIHRAGISTLEERFTRFALKWADHFVQSDGGIRTHQIEEFNLDQINAGKLLFIAYRNTGEARYRRALQQLREQLNRQPRTQAGGFWHKQIYPYQMWLDGLYMAGPFYAEYAQTFDEPAGFDDVTHQLILAEAKMRDPHTGLLYHAWDESREQRWANPKTGCSPHFWGRGMGWYAMALADVLDFLPDDHPHRPDLVTSLARLVEAVARVQDRATGLWYQILDQAERAGNYLESSASGMFVYAIAKGVRKGYLADGAMQVARRGFHGLVTKFVSIDDQGLSNFAGACSVAGLGGNPYRDGSFDYYVSEPVVTNDFKGLGAFILAAVEIESAGAKDRSAS